MPTIDLNSDLGENSAERHVSDDLAMVKLVTSANISCGFHAGTPVGIAQTVAAAHQCGVIIGAHPSYRDYEGFGRRSLEVEPTILQAEVEEQVAGLIEVAGSVGARVRYVKPHGALYHRIAVDAAEASVVVAAIRAVDASLMVLGLSGGVILDVARRAGLDAAAEAFADRAYQPDGRLVNRSVAGAVLHDADVVAERMLTLVSEGTITAIDGSTIAVQADSICVHGDSPGAVAMAAAVRQRLEAVGCSIAPFAA